MLITNLMRARDYLPVQREAARILNSIFERLDVRPMPDGQVVFRFEADVAFLDRMALWGVTVEDVEGLLDEDEAADSDGEHDGRGFDKLISAPRETKDDSDGVGAELVAA